MTVSHTSTECIMRKTNRSSGLICLSPHRDYDSHRWVRLPVGSQLPRHGDRAFPLHGHNRPPGLLQRSSALRSQQENTGERSKVSRPLIRTTHSRHTEHSYSLQTAAFITHLFMRFTFTSELVRCMSRWWITGALTCLSTSRLWVKLMTACKGKFIFCKK